MPQERKKKKKNAKQTSVAAALATGPDGSERTEKIKLSRRSEHVLGSGSAAVATGGTRVTWCVEWGGVGGVGRQV